MHIQHILALACSFTIVAFAQAKEGKFDPTAGLVIPFAGAPLFVEAVGTTENVLPDGSIETETKRSKTYRDSEGRVRVDSMLQYAAPPAPPEPLIQITDPVAGFQFLLHVTKQTAYRIALPKFVPPARLRFGFAAGSELILETGAKTHKGEELGTRTIAGVEFKGGRTTTTMVDEPTKIAVDEYWISQELGLIGAVRKSSPRGKVTVDVETLTHDEPDSSLFAIPPEFTIKNIEFPDPPK